MKFKLMNLNILASLDSRKKIIIVVSLFIVSIGLIIYFLVIPTVNDIRKIRTEIEAQRIDLETKYLRGQSIKKLAEDLKTIEPDLIKLDQVFINRNRELDFITTLEKIAGDNNINQTITLGSPDNSDSQPFVKIPLKLNASGNFVNLAGYLDELETLNYYLNIQSLEFSSGRAILIPGLDSGSGGNINLLISADTYWK